MAKILGLTLSTLILGLLIRVHPEHAALSIVAWGSFLLPVAGLFEGWRPTGRLFIATMAGSLVYNAWFHIYLAETHASAILASWFGTGG